MSFSARYATVDSVWSRNYIHTSRSGYDVYHVTCIVGKWLQHLAYGLVFVALILRIWRVKKLMVSGVRRVAVTLSRVQRSASSGCYIVKSAADASVWTIVVVWIPADRHVCRSTSQIVCHESRCRHNISYHKM